MSKANFVPGRKGKSQDFGGIARVLDIAAENTVCPSARRFQPPMPCIPTSGASR